MPNDLSTNERTVLKVVAESSQGLNVFSIARRTKLNPLELARIARRLAQLGLIDIGELRLMITDPGRALIVNQPEAFQKPKALWRKVPDEMRVTPIPPFAPYIPQITNVDVSILPEVYAKIVESFRRGGGSETSTLE